MERAPKPDNVSKAQRRGDHKALSAMGKKGAEVRAIRADERHVFEDAEAERRKGLPIPRDIVNKDGDVVPNPDFYEQAGEEN